MCCNASMGLQLNRLLQVRVIHCPTVCKALVSHPTATVADYRMKVSNMHNDGKPAVLTASIDQAGVCVLSVFGTPKDGASQSDPLWEKGPCSININTGVEPVSHTSCALVDTTDTKVAAVYGAKLFELDIEACLQSSTSDRPLQCSATMPAGNAPQPDPSPQSAIPSASFIACAVASTALSADVSTCMYPPSILLDHAAVPPSGDFRG